MALSPNSHIRASQAAQAAQEAAARINQQLGVASSGPPSSIPKPHLEMVSTEEYAVPDKMVGLSE